MTTQISYSIKDHSDLEGTWSAKLTARGLDRNAISDPQHAINRRENLALSCDAKAALAISRATLHEIRSQAPDAFDELGRRRDAVLAILLRKWAFYNTLLADATRQRNPKEVIGYFVPADMRNAEQLSGFSHSAEIEWPCRDHDGTLFTRTCRFSNIATPNGW